MAFARPGFAAHQENVNTVKSLYLKTNDFSVQRRLRPLCWIFKDQVIDVLFYQEGWHIPDEVDPKTKKPKFPNGKPVRFPAEMKADEFPALDWKEDSYQNSKPRKKTPESAVSMLVWDYNSASLKIASFTQKTVLKAINQYISPNNEDGSENAAYIENLTTVDIIIKKIDDKTWNINIREGNPKIPLEAWKELGALQFSWDNFMSGESDMEHAPVLADFLDQVEGNVQVETKEEQIKRLEKQAKAKEAANKNTTATPASTATNQQKEKPTPTTKASTDKSNPDWWKDVATAKGTKVGDMTQETRVKTKDWFEAEKPDTCKNSNLYLAVCAGIEANKPKEEIPEDDGFVVEDDEASPFE